MRASATTRTGKGIRREDARNLFQPFFSTKSTKGAGLGLWISKGIVQKYEGRISFRSCRGERGCVTCFRVFLPGSGMASAPFGEGAKRDSTSSRPGNAPAGQDRILQPTIH
ncbi:MAG: ATP-binding protein [Acidobacteriota bacterium]